MAATQHSALSDRSTAFVVHTNSQSDENVTKQTCDLCASKTVVKLKKQQVEEEEEEQMNILPFTVLAINCWKRGCFCMEIGKNIEGSHRIRMNNKKCQECFIVNKCKYNKLINTKEANFKCKRQFSKPNSLRYMQLCLLTVTALLQFLVVTASTVAGAAANSTELVTHIDIPQQQLPQQQHFNNKRESASFEFLKDIQRDAMSEYEAQQQGHKHHHHHQLISKKRSIYGLSNDATIPERYTTVATPVLTTLRYSEKSSDHRPVGFHHRNYELDLERDHALPTSAPNADILKSNSNPTYPNPNNRYYNHDRNHNRHLINVTPASQLPNIYKKTNPAQQLPPTVPIYSGELPQYSPPSRAFFTPPLPPEYQNPFADKPTLRGTNNEGLISNTNMYINRRPIPPPSLMPGHELIPFRPPELIGGAGSNTDTSISNITGNSDSGAYSGIPLVNNATEANSDDKIAGIDVKKALNTPHHHQNTGSREMARGGNSYLTSKSNGMTTSKRVETDLAIKVDSDNNNHNNNNVDKYAQKKDLPNIKRLLSGTIPEVLLKRPASVVPNDATATISNVLQHQQTEHDLISIAAATADGSTVGVVQSNINKMRPSYSNSNENVTNEQGSTTVSSTLREAVVLAAAAAATSTPNTAVNKTISAMPTVLTPLINASNKTATATITTTHATAPSSATIAIDNMPFASWAIAWNLHVYLCVVLFTILSVFSLYKMITYNKLTHLFSQSYFLSIHLILISVCATRIFYLCYDAYNIHSTFDMFVSELLLNLPAAFLTISFSVLILFLYRKSLNHKNNRYSALVRPLTVVVACGVHIVLCITLHYVESYTMQNHMLQQQQHAARRQQHVAYTMQQQQQTQLLGSNGNHMNYGIATAAPPRVLSLICQIIYIFICLALGFLYLYLYRLLKRILHSKSQNYIHCYQNLSYAIHITIATALLFVLLAVLQIFGVISMSSRNLSIMILNDSEIDWLQWGYQFSLRLIEIAIVTLLSWVAGLKTSSGGGIGGNNGSESSNGIVQRQAMGVGVGAAINANDPSDFVVREKYQYPPPQAPQHSRGFFLPCTSRSSHQEQYETDYPAVCNANTNLHSYTMRTGKLIYDDSFALSSMTNSRNADYQIQQQPTYQRPYDNGGSLRNASQRNSDQYSTTHQYADYLTDGTVDHYENPNFDLRTPIDGNKMFAAASVGNSSAASSDTCQQVLLLKHDNCYAEPLQPINSYIESPKYNCSKQHQQQQQQHHHGYHMAMNYMAGAIEGKNKQAQSESCSINSGHSDMLTESNYYNSSNSKEGRYGREATVVGQHFNNSIRKSGTLDSIILNSGAYKPASTNLAATGIMPKNRQKQCSNAISSTQPKKKRTSKAKAAELLSEHAAKQRYLYSSSNTMERAAHVPNCATAYNVYQGQKQQQQQRDISDDEDMVLTSSNVECTNLINNENGSFITNNSSSSATTTSVGNLTDQGICSNSTSSDKSAYNNHNLQQQHKSVGRTATGNTSAAPQHLEHTLNQEHMLPTSSGLESEEATLSSSSNTDESSRVSSKDKNILITDQGFLRFRPLDDINNAQGVGIHNASIRNLNKCNGSNI